MALPAVPVGVEEAFLKDLPSVNWDSFSHTVIPVSPPFVFRVLDGESSHNMLKPEVKLLWLHASAWLRVIISTSSVVIYIPGRVSQTVLIFLIIRKTKYLGLLWKVEAGGLWWLVQVGKRAQIWEQAAWESKVSWLSELQSGRGQKVAFKMNVVWTEYIWNFHASHHAWYIRRAEKIPSERGKKESILGVLKARRLVSILQRSRTDRMNTDDRSIDQSIDR